MKRGLTFWVSIPPWWQHAKTKCVFQTYAIICKSGNTQTFKLKIFNHQYILLFYIWTAALQCGGGGCLFFLSPLSQGDHRTPLYTTGKGTPKHTFHRSTQKTIPKACTCISYVNQPGRNLGKLLTRFTPP